MKARRPILLPILVLLLASLPSQFQEKSCKAQRVVDGDTLLIVNLEWVTPIRTDILEFHGSKKIHLHAERTGRNLKTMQVLGKRASGLPKS